MEKIAAVILAAGKGTRMNEGQASPIPKVMFPLAGKPMIYYSVSSVRSAGIQHIVLVVGYKQEMVRDYVGDGVEYAVQKQQLGTGQAVAAAKSNLLGRSEKVLVTYGDMPLITPRTIKELAHQFEKERPTIALLSVDFKDPESWAFGRIIRNSFGDVEKIVEQKDCTAAELKIRESNTGVYVFAADWLWSNINRIENKNAQREYYLTDMVEMARAQNKRVIALKSSNEYEAAGINNPNQLQLVEELVGRKERGDSR